MKPRKIESLQPNECIHIRDEKDSKKIVRLINTTTGNKITPLDFSNCYLYFNSSWLYDDEEPKDKLPISSKLFLPSKKSTRKMVKELVSKLSNYEARLKNVEDRLVEKEFGITAEQTFVLPEKWCVKYDENIYPVLKELHENLTAKEGYYHGEKKYYPDSWLVTGFIGDNYTEITTEQFIKHVLKRDDLSGVEEALGSKEKNVGLEANKWYKDTNYNQILFFNGTTQSYGLTDDVWSDLVILDDVSGLVEASPQDIEAALISEAKRRGLENGVKVEVPKSGGAKYTIDNAPSRYDDRNLLYVGSIKVFDNGKWATIIDQTKEIDFSIAGQLLEYDGLLVETTGLQNREEFSGFLKKASIYPIGFTSNTWVKSRFKLCNT